MFRCMGTTFSKGVLTIGLTWQSADSPHRCDANLTALRRQWKVSKQTKAATAPTITTRNARDGHTIGFACVLRAYIQAPHKCSLTCLMHLDSAARGNQDYKKGLLGQEAEGDARNIPKRKRAKEEVQLPRALNWPSRILWPSADSKLHELLQSSRGFTSLHFARKYEQGKDTESLMEVRPAASPSPSGAETLCTRYCKVWRGTEHFEPSIV